jgi:hypothetical protein
MQGRFWPSLEARLELKQGVAQIPDPPPSLGTESLTLCAFCAGLSLGRQGRRRYSQFAQRWRKSLNWTHCVNLQASMRTSH